MFRTAEKNSVRSMNFVALALLLIYLFIYFHNYEQETYNRGKKRDYEFLQSVFACKLPETLEIMQSVWYDRSELSRALYEICLSHSDLQYLIVETNAQASDIGSGWALLHVHFEIDAFTFTEHYTIINDDYNIHLIVDHSTSPTMKIYVQVSNYQFMQKIREYDY